MGAPRAPDRDRNGLSAPGLDKAIVTQLRSIHAIKAGALAMFDPMLAKVAAERDDRYAGRDG